MLRHNVVLLQEIIAVYLVLLIKFISNLHQLYQAHLSHSLSRRSSMQPMQFPMPTKWLKYLRLLVVKLMQLVHQPSLSLLNSPETSQLELSISVPSMEVTQQLILLDSNSIHTFLKMVKSPSFSLGSILISSALDLHAPSLQHLNKEQDLTPIVELSAIINLF